MNVTQSLLDFILNLMRDEHAKAAFNNDPDKALADAGLSNVASEDVADAMSYASEYEPVSFVGNREYNMGDTNVSQHAGNDQPDEGHRHESYQPDPHATPVQQLEYISNNYSYSDSHDTLIDKSINQNIWNTGDLSQSFEDNSVTATDGSVAAGRDISGDVANGDGNVVGDGNSVGNTDNRTDNSIRDSFNSSNTADNGGIAGNGNAGNVTDPYQSSSATNGSAMDNSSYTDNSQTAIDSGNTKTITDKSDNSDNSVQIDNDSDNSVTDSNNGSDNEDSLVNQSHTDQTGLVNVSDVLSNDSISLDH